ncbi:MAG: HlyC/CorC family transporter [Candidatus Nitrosopelagicus sp.]|jgi:CBS domain containing-hemolysin-like protein|nr:HlyC/CorC family transporter [Candidatus Nitrosopelagicus sp.]MBT4325963.1 HlyC/CorC family transporter [Candidatus Nitrosopelagicus sp.]MBT4455008.1 HlyC/CorC family transporter [Candidatus Nitrosopelagicus sp.]|tara:strand:+ start:1498 stop:2742 length:1245 start_codon:yes stop_codon:yes gene_type:complete
MQLEFEIPLLVVLIGLSGFFSGLEVALVGVRMAKVEQMVKDKVKGSTSLLKLKKNPSRMMASVNLGNNLVNVASTAIATDIALKIFGNDGLAIVIGIMTFLILVFGEITPKTYCNANAPKIAARYSRILLAFSYAFYPIVIMLESITKGIIRLTGSSDNPPGLTEDEIKGVIDQGLKDKAIEKQESELVHGALNFDDIVIRSVMTPRTKMFTLNSKKILFEALPEINNSGFSRIPVYSENSDNIIGIVHVRDVLKSLEHDEKVISLESIMREPIFVSQEKMVSDLLKEMQGRQTHMAIVVDEFGGVEGCVTLEDLLEEIVGEIHDEKDTVQEIFQSEGNDTILTDGDIEIDKINEIFRTSIPEGDDYSRLNGLLHEKLRDIPKEGDKIEIDSLRIIIEKVSKNKPDKIRIEKIR